MFFKFLLFIVIVIISTYNIEKFIWNINTRNTKNMSLDLRCVPYIKPKFYPFQYPSVFPSNRICKKKYNYILNE